MKDPNVARTKELMTDLESEHVDAVIQRLIDAKNAGYTEIKIEYRAMGYEQTATLVAVEE